MTKPATVMFNKVDIKNGDQAGKMFGPAQEGIGKAVIDSVKSGIIPKDEAANILICEDSGLELPGDQNRNRAGCKRRTVDRRC